MRTAWVRARFVGIVLGLMGGPIGAGLGADGPSRPEGEPVPEVLEMFWSIVVNGANMAPGSAWFHPGQSRHGWDWLAARGDSDHDGRITEAEFPGPKAQFARLDRDRDGAITPADLDWSPRSPYLQQQQQLRGRFAQVDRDSSGKITREELLALFDRQAQDKDYLSPDDLYDLFYAPPPRQARPAGPPPDMPGRVTLLKGLFSGEIGSAFEGPALNALGPDFTLPTHDGLTRFRLSDFRGHKPVVLIFGSFT